MTTDERPGPIGDDRSGQPRRIRRQRTKGWTLAGATTNPHGAVAVDRTSRWGNPHAVRQLPGRAGAWTVVDPRTGQSSDRWPTKLDAQAAAVDRFRGYLAENPELVDAARRALAGRDLACYCAEDDDSCHADVWLAVVNTQGDQR